MKTIRALALASALVGLPGAAMPVQAGSTDGEDTVAVARDPAPAAEERGSGTEPGETLAVARDLLALMSEEMINNLVGQVTDRMWPSIEGRLLAYNPDIDPSSLGGLRVELERIQVDYMMNVVKEGPEIYAQHFSADELREIIAFYRTPVGAKLLEKTPQLTKEVTDVITPHMPKFFENTMEAFAKVLRAKGYSI